ncbi:uncharacterized protein [Physcomitrium patens]|uniref:VLRF1 domain-containing protein n=1 Tax=Physcomitrium patens TaxID=3218 RepID=A0A2K1KXQ3_PHYPA|nr:ankyrin repeat and zinc finger domain-containing protein 1-like [Physcomitrium patens]PNR58551.1 hypothetical protein PHYPA_005546 [Physcomitrium patens]|eukprot:XP_024371985.1 ankyrin repeat and zinc finger domain-containing protein 1-like [Physcomitrella patens]
MAQLDLPSLFTAPHGFFDSALLFTHRHDALAQPLPPSPLLGLGFQRLQLRDGIDVSSSLDQAPAASESLLQSWACHGCRAVFQSLEEQRAHFKSDFHKFNVKRKIAGKETLNENEFEEVTQGNDGDVSSISGSDSETEADDSRISSSLVSRSNQLHVKLNNSGDIIILWRCLIAADKEILPGEKGYSTDETTAASLCLKEDEVLRRLKSLTSREKKSVWVILLAAGGHFAGLVINSQDGSILAHQTFHRYVVRAKAGGRQSARDATGRAPQSAGASLRRYNEQALQKDIRDLLTSWSEHMQAASHIFVYAPSSNAQTLFGGENASLNRNDRRIRRIPFTTRRPTMKEAKRISHLLSWLQRLDLEAIHATADIPVTVGRSGRVTTLVGKDSSNVPAQTGKTSDRTKLKPPQVDNQVSAEQVEGSKLSSEDNLGLTPLHLAAKAGDTVKVLNLLVEGADPCLKDKMGKTPYILAKDKETRNVFRRFMAQHLDKWDWHGASVPSPLTDELEAAQIAKQAEKDAKRKAKEKERKKLKKAEEKAKQVEAKAEAEAKAAAASVRYDKDRAKEMLKTSKLLDPKSKEYQEALLKAQAQEREIRAAAAEFRLRAVAGANQKPASSTSINSSSTSLNAPNLCSCCQASLAGKVPFTRYSYQYCSTTCVRVHKIALEEE